MKKIIFTVMLVVMSSMACAKDNMENNLLRFLYFNDLKTWVEGGDSLLDWSSYSNRDKLISKDFYAPHLIIHEFDRNIYDASNKYNKVPTLLKGVVHSVKADRNNKPIVSFVAGYGDQFEALGFDIEDVQGLKRGQQFEFVCYQFAYNGITLGSKNCTTLEKYYNLVSLEIFDNININTLNNNGTAIMSQIYKAVETVPKGNLKDFYNNCGDKPADDGKCLNQIQKLAEDGMLKVKKAP